MARGWGRSEEDQLGDKEQALERTGPRLASSTSERDRLIKRRGIELSLARIQEQLRKVSSPSRRMALEAAREELQRQLAEI